MQVGLWHKTGLTDSIQLLINGAFGCVEELIPILPKYLPLLLLSLLIAFFPGILLCIVMKYPVIFKKVEFLQSVSLSNLELILLYNLIHRQRLFHSRCLYLVMNWKWKRKTCPSERLKFSICLTYNNNLKSQSWDFCKIMADEK